MHDELVRRGRRRLRWTAVLAALLLAVAASLACFPLVWLSGLVLAWVPGGWGAGWQLVRVSALLATGLGTVVAVGTLLWSWYRAERDALRSVQLRLGTLAGSSVRAPDRRSGPAGERQVRALLDGLALAAGVPAPRVVVVADDAPNALTVGRRPQTAVIVVTSGLVHGLPRRELESVLAYELGRVACAEVSLDTVVYAATARAWELWAAAFDELDEASLLLVPLALLGLPLLGGALLLRRRALRARATLSDGLALRYTREPAALARALERIRRAGRSTRFAGTANAHLWLVEPPSGWSRVLGSERLLDDRIGAVTALAAGVTR